MLTHYASYMLCYNKRSHMDLFDKNTGDIHPLKAAVTSNVQPLTELIKKNIMAVDQT